MSEMVKYLSGHPHNIRHLVVNVWSNSVGSTRNSQESVANMQVCSQKSELNAQEQGIMFNQSEDQGYNQRDQGIPILHVEYEI
jgi:hypothetical protein